MANKKTWKKAGKNASKVLRSKSTSKKSKSAAGSALAQRKNSKKTWKKAASNASKTLKDWRSSKVSKSAAGSALSQKKKNSARAPKKPVKKGKKKK